MATADGAVDVGTRTTRRILGGVGELVEKLFDFLANMVSPPEPLTPEQIDGLGEAAEEREVTAFAAAREADFQRLLDQIAAPEPAGARLLNDAAEAMRLTARGYHRVLRVARTIADLDDAEKVARVHIAEALSYRKTARL